MSPALTSAWTPGKGHYQAPAPSAEVRESWDRFVAAKAATDASLSYEAGRTSALAFWDFVSVVGSAEALVALVGPLVRPDDPLVSLLWSIAADLRRGGPTLLRRLAAGRQRLRLEAERDEMLAALQAEGAP